MTSTGLPREALNECAFYFTEAHHALDQHAQAYDGGGGGHVFDDLASWQAHAAMHRDRHRDAVDRYKSVAATFAMLPTDTRDVLAAAFSPHPWSYPLRLAFRMPRSELSLVGVALLTDEVHAAWKAAGSRRAPRPKGSPKVDHGAEASFEDLVAWLDEEVRPKVVKGKETHGLSKRVLAIRVRATDVFADAVHAYDRARVERELGCIEAELRAA